MKHRIATYALLSFLTVLMLGCGTGSTPISTPPVPTVGNGYRQVNILASTQGIAPVTDPSLTAPWGMSFGPNQPFCIASSNRGIARIFDNSGLAALPLGIGIPLPTGAPGPAHPTSVVSNINANDFIAQGVSAQYLFTTTEGTVSVWGVDSHGNYPSFASLVVINNGADSVYTGLALPLRSCCGQYLALADFHNGIIARRDTAFNLLNTAGTFTDPNLPAGYAPYNIQTIGSEVLVAYALQDSTRTQAVPGAGNGIVDIFDSEGIFVRRLASNGPLNAPWGIAQATASFGPFSNAILIGNTGDGAINAFDPATGTWLGQLRDRSGNPILNPGLKALTFRSDGYGTPNTLYFTAGSTSGDGLFGTIVYQP